MNDELTFNIQTSHSIANEPTTEQPHDSMIAIVPDGVYVTVDGTKVIDAGRASQTLLRLCTKAGEAIGEHLHHADVVVTSDPDVVRQRGNFHNCPRCRAGTDQALAHLRQNPNAQLFVGLLWWCVDRGVTP